MSKRVEKPEVLGQCWGTIKLMKCSLGPGSAQCRNNARTGFLTCPFHRKLEEEARLLKEAQGKLHAVS